ncbi:unknown [Prevotella sp. CAG:617]|nr:unknown [Prevotella sp. CAG:617]
MLSADGLQYRLGQLAHAAVSLGGVAEHQGSVAGRRQAEACFVTLQLIVGDFGSREGECTVYGAGNLLALDDAAVGVDTFRIDGEAYAAVGDVNGLCLADGAELRSLLLAVVVRNEGVVVNLRSCGREVRALADALGVGAEQFAVGVAAAVGHYGHGAHGPGVALQAYGVAALVTVGLVSTGSHLSLKGQVFGRHGEEVASVDAQVVVIVSGAERAGQIGRSGTHGDGIAYAAGQARRELADVASGGSVLEAEDLSALAVVRHLFGHPGIGGIGRGGVGQVVLSLVVKGNTFVTLHTVAELIGLAFFQTTDGGVAVANGRLQLGEILCRFLL